MECPWHYAYQDLDRLWALLETMNRRNVDQPDDEVKLRFYAYYVAVRLFGDFAQSGISAQKSYNAFIAGEMGDAFRPWEQLMALQLRRNRKNCFDALCTVLALSFSNTSDGDRAYAESQRVWEGWESNGTEDPTDPARVNLILAYLARGQAETLRGNQSHAAKAFNTAWRLLMRKGRPPAGPPDAGGTGEPPNRGATGAGESTSTQAAAEEDQLSRWFFENLPATYEVVDWEDMLKASTISQPTIMAMRCLITTLLAKHLARWEISEGVQALVRKDSHVAFEHFERARMLLNEAENSIQIWPFMKSLSVQHFHAEMVMLKAIVLSAIGQTNIMEQFVAITMKTTPADRTTYLQEFSKAFKSIVTSDNTGVSLFMQMADDLFVKKESTDKLKRFSRRFDVSLNLVRALLEFDEGLYFMALNLKANSSLVLVWHRYKESALSMSVWSWPEIILILANLLRNLEKLAPHRTELLERTIVLINALLELQTRGVTIQPIFDVTQQWNDLIQDQRICKLVRELRQIGKRI